ncbi:ATP-binding protein [Streptomyces sp. NPDC057694]|uniref:ATP-binding protein n=1 Tax=Streptomyces sp. NPDC057694 TaxID=3346216 RepID=UPI00367CF32E
MTAPPPRGAGFIPRIAEADVTVPVALPTILHPPTDPTAGFVDIRPTPAARRPSAAPRALTARIGPVSAPLPPQTMRADLLIGRDDDLERVSQVLGDENSGGSLVLSGDPGVGKSTLLEALARSAADSGARVLRVAGVQSEADVSYAALNQALLPLRDTIDAVGGEHRDALRVALGFGGGRPPQRLMVFTAALTVLQAAASERQVVLVVDDLPRLDRVSAAAFGFIARRISGTPVSFLGAMRSGGDSFFETSGLPIHELRPLDSKSATCLVDSCSPGLGRQIRRRVLEAAQGNPLALVELPDALRAGRSETLETAPAVLPLSQRLQSLYVSRVRALPRATQTVLLLAVLEGSLDLGILQAAARAMGVFSALEELAPAEHDQLVCVDQSTRRLVFQHPLIQSAVVEAFTSDERRTAHEFLAQALVNQPESRAWHLGEATLEPDEGVAKLLEDAAHRILHRGNAATAVSALVRAAELSPLNADRGRRLAQAAYLGAEATGAFHSASEMLEVARQADPELDTSLHSTAAKVLLMLNSDGDVIAAHRILVAAIEEGAHGYDADDGALIDALHLLSLLCVYAGRPELWAPFHTALSRLRPQSPALLSVLGRLHTDPAGVGPATLTQLERIFDDAATEADPGQIVRIGTIAVASDRLAAVRASSWRVVKIGRTGGSLRRHLAGLLHLSLDAYYSGRWTETEELSDEGLELCEDTGYGFFSWYFHYSKGLVSASRGDTDTAHSLADRMLDWASPRGLRGIVQYAQHVRVLAHVANGEFEEAFRHASAVSRAGELADSQVACRLFFDFVESALRTQRTEEAVAHVRAVRASSVEALSVRLAMLAGAAGALATEDDTEALRQLEQTLSSPSVAAWPFDQARVQLALGERLRRSGEIPRCKEPLESALRTFRRLGAHAWVRRAASELRAAGSPTPIRGEEQAQLTPREREIVELAASGMTNKQIAERLFLSHRTVGAHLYRVYPKLYITSRGGLRDALSALEAHNEGKAI